MPLVQAVYNVRILLANVPVMLVIRAPNVMLLVGVIPLDQAARHVISQQVNVLAKLDTQEQHVTPATQITTEQVTEHVQVSIILSKHILQLISIKCIHFQPVVAMPLVQVVCSVLIHLVNVPAMLVTKAPNVMLLVVVILLVQVVQHVMRQQVNVLVIVVIQVPRVVL